MASLLEPLLDQPSILGMYALHQQLAADGHAVRDAVDAAQARGVDGRAGAQVTLERTVAQRVLGSSTERIEISGCPPCCLPVRGHQGEALHNWYLRG